MGYLVIDIVDGIALVRTFLFITNDGAPEGEILKEKIGLERIDKKYLAIDKLSTFLSQEFRENETLKKIFAECGLGELYELEKESVQEVNKPYHTVEIIKFLGLDQEEDEIND